jgi:YD repeat-containing protein
VTQRLAIFDSRGYLVEERTENSFGAARPNASGSFGFRHVNGSFGLPALSQSIGRDGQSVPFGGSMARYRRDYDETGNVIRKTFEDEFGRPTFAPDGTHVTEFRYDDQGNCVSIRRLGPAGTLESGAGGWAATEFVIGSDGLPATQVHFCAAGSPERTDTLAPVVKLVRDSNGRIVELSQHGPDGSSQWAFGVPILRIPRDSFGRELGYSYHSASGEPVVGIRGNHSSRRSFDPTGRLASLEYLGPSGELVMTSFGYARLQVDVDERNCVIGSTVFGPQSSKPIRTFGRGAIVRWLRDDRGNVVEIKNFDEAMRPVLVGDGHHAIRRTLDQAGRIELEQRLDTRGNVLSGPDGVAASRIAFDDRGRTIEVTNLDADGRPRSSAQGWARKTISYQDDVRAEEHRFFDVAGALRSSDCGAASVTRRLDCHGRTIEERFFDALGDPCPDEEGAELRRHTRDARGRLVALECFDSRGEPALDSNAVHRTEWTFDPGGRMVRVRYLGVNGCSVFNAQGVHRTDFEFDWLGSCIASRNFGPDGNPACGQGVFGGMITPRDPRGRIVERVYLGPGHQPAMGPEGVVCVRYTYDEFGRVSTELFLDELGRPMWNRDAIAGRRFEYDEHGRIASTTCVDPDGVTVRNRQGFSTERKSYDDRGLMTDVKRFNEWGLKAADDFGVCQEQYSYDERGFRIAEFFGDRLGNGITGANGYAGRFCSVDGRGRVVAELQSNGPDRHPAASEISAKRRFWHDARGSVIRRVTYAPGDVLEMTEDIRYEVDEAGRVLARRYFGADGQPSSDSDGFHMYRQMYDSLGRLVEERGFGIEGNPAVGGIASVVVFSRDPCGDVTRAEFFDDRGSRSRNSGGHYAVVRRRDARGNEVESRYIDELDDEDRSLLAGHGSTFRHEFNERNLETKYSTHLPDGGLQSYGQYAIKTTRYDSRNRVVERAVFGESGEPVDGLGPLQSKGECEEPFHRWVIDYSDSEQLVSFRFFRADGSECRSP